MKFLVPVSWTEMGYHVIEAESKEEAIEKAYGLPLPEESEYLCDSLVVDKYAIEEKEEDR